MGNIKLGKVNWDRMLLELIQMSERRELIDALDPYYKALKTERNQFNEHSIKYDKALQAVKHLENKSALTEEEYYEWEGSVGWLDNIGEEIGFREESLATGLTIALWKLVNNLSLTVASGLKSRSIPVESKFHIFRLGPKIGNEPWALALNAASNYVRHADDWNKNLRKHIRNGAGSWKTDIPDKENADTKRNLLILENIGCDVELLISPNDLSFSIAEKIRIIKQSEMEKLYFSWVEDVYQFSKTQLKL